MPAPAAVYRGRVDGGHRQPWRLGPRGERWFDAALVAGLLLPAPVFLLAGHPVPVALAVAQVVPLLWRRRQPVAVFAAVATASGLQAVLLDDPLWSQAAFPVATYSVARFAAPAWGAAAAAVGLLGAAVAARDWLVGYYPAGLPASAFLAYFLTIGAIVVAAWALGAMGRTRQQYVDALVERGARLEREAAQQAALAAAEERNRIAREMHDVVAHGLTTIVVQADGARHAAARDPAIATSTLATVADTGREALAELRRMLGLLRSGQADVRPQPRLADLPDLLADVASAGTPVRTSLPDPLPAVSDGVALTAYRVVQEALTNVRKHAGPGATADVRVTAPAAGDGELTVEVSDDGRGAAASYDGRGLGLAGMAERVAAHGGRLDAGPRPGGGFRVAARIPL